MPASAFAVTTSKLTKEYAGGAGVFDLDIDIEPGTIVGFIGPSGSGKTTTVHLLTGVLASDSGTADVLDERPLAFSRNTRARIGYMPQESILYPDLTLRENLNFAASLYGVPYRRKEKLRDLIDFVELEGAVDRLPQDASGGEKRRVMLASTLIHDPELIFLDEPTAGVDPVLRRKFWDRFGDLAKGGKTLVITTQYVGEAAYCDFVAVLAEGRILTVDTPEGLRRQAYGGEIIEMVFATPPGSDDLISLEESVALSLARVETDRVRLVVADADAAIQAIGEWAEQRGLEVDKTELYLAPFDDVFVELVSRLQNDEETSNGP
ncbi:MAG TPA: ABC transporter ATP-binding protein [Acidimicrobiia bacterium]|nr:ABC transporter ATP-binding protein [Acidimicrobiia bacterium]